MNEMLSHIRSLQMFDGAVRFGSGMLFKKWKIYQRAKNQLHPQVANPQINLIKFRRNDPFFKLLPLSTVRYGTNRKTTALLTYRWNTVRTRERSNPFSLVRKQHTQTIVHNNRTISRNSLFFLLERCKSYSIRYRIIKIFFQL